MIISSLLLVCHGGFGGQDEQAKQIVRQSIANVRAAHSLTGKAQLLGPAKMDIRFVFAKPGSYSVVMSDQEFHYDGNVFWMYRATGKSALREKMPVSAAMQVVFLMGFEPMFGEPATPSKSIEMTDWNGKHVAAATIDDAADSKTRVFFDPETKLPCGFEQMHGTFSFSASYSDMKLNGSFDPKEFSYTPPADAKITKVPDFSLFMPGMSAPDFTLKTPSGGALHLKEMMQGHKATLLNFWFVGCGPCREEYPHLQQLYNDLKDKGLQIVSVNNGDSKQEVSKFLKDHSYTFPVCLSAPTDVTKRFNVDAFPTNYVLDEKGRVIDSFTGFNRGRLYAALKKAGVPVDSLGN